MTSAAWVALLRAVNVGGRGKVAMAELRELAEEVGFESARTILNSGNLVFRGDARSAAEIERRLESAARRRLSLDTRFFVRSGPEWERLVARNPFPEEARRDPGHLLVLCLKDAADPKDVAALQAEISGRERVRASGREAYVVYPDGIGRSRVTLPWIERRLGTPATGRNWNTVVRLASLQGFPL